MLLTPLQRDAYAHPQAAPEMPAVHTFARHKIALSINK